MVDAIKVKKRDNGLALGANIDDYREAGWNATAMGFNDVLGLLKKEYGGSKEAKELKMKKKKRKDNKETSSNKKLKKHVPIIQVGMKYVTSIIHLHILLAICMRH